MQDQEMQIYLVWHALHVIIHNSVTNLNVRTILFLISFIDFMILVSHHFLKNVFFLVIFVLLCDKVM